MLLTAVGSGPIHAAVVVWDAGGGTNFNWNTPANWLGDVVPTETEDVLFPMPIPNPVRFCSLP
ncbi:MAG: hypothetical protein QM775_30815 [Pirellulales bacterium]